MGMNPETMLFFPADLLGTYHVSLDAKTSLLSAADQTTLDMSEHVGFSPNDPLVNHPFPPVKLPFGRYLPFLLKTLPKCFFFSGKFRV